MTHPFPTRRSSDLINWTTQALTADGPAFFGRYWLGAQPWENHELYWSRSPLSLVGNVETPTMVVVGAEDYRTPVSESERSEEHTSELQSLMRISYAVFCLKKKKQTIINIIQPQIT